MPGIFPCKNHEIKNNVNIRSCLLFHSCSLRISRNYLPHWGKMQEALLVPFSIYGVWGSEDALFLALYDSNNWDVLKILSERTLQNMTKLTWERRRVKSDFLGEKKHFSNFLCCLVFFFLFVVIHGYTLYRATRIKIPICRREHEYLKSLFMYLKKSNSRTRVSNIWNENINWSKCTSKPDDDIFSLVRFTSDVDYWQERNVSGSCLHSKGWWQPLLDTILKTWRTSFCNVTAMVMGNMALFSDAELWLKALTCHRLIIGEQVWQWWTLISFNKPFMCHTFTAILCSPRSCT